MKNQMRNFFAGVTVFFLFTSTHYALASGVSDFSVCFSPMGHCDVKIVSFAASAHSTLDIAIYDLTLGSLVQTLAKLKQSGIQIRMVVDRSEAKTPTSLVRSAIQSGIAVRLGNVRGIMHNKFMIVDGKMLETGSFNYTQSATSSNAENQLYLDNPEVVSQYQSQFNTLWENGLPPEE